MFQLLQLFCDTWNFYHFVKHPAFALLILRINERVAVAGSKPKLHDKWLHTWNSCDIGFVSVWWQRIASWLAMSCEKLFCKKAGRKIIIRWQQAEFIFCCSFSIWIIFRFWYAIQFLPRTTPSMKIWKQNILNNL